MESLFFLAVKYKLGESVGISGSASNSLEADGQ